MPIPSATLRVGFKLLSSSFCVSPGHRNSSLRSVTSSSGLRSGRMELLCPRLTSATSSRRLSATVALKAKLQISPGNAHPPSRLCPPHIRPSFPYRYRTLNLFASSSSLHASYAISVRRASALPAASFRFHLTVDTLAVRLTIPPVGFVGDFHSQVSAPCQAHTDRKAASFEAALL